MNRGNQVTHGDGVSWQNMLTAGVVNANLGRKALHLSRDRNLCRILASIHAKAKLEVGVHRE